MGAVYDRLVWADYVAVIKAHLHISGTAHNVLLEQLFKAAKQRVDAYLNRSWTEEVPQVTFASVGIGDSVAIDGISFEGAAATDEEDREFAVGVDDATDAQALADLVNSTCLAGTYAVGVRDVIATRTDATIVFTKCAPRAKKIIVTSSDDDTLRVQYVLGNQTIPEEVVAWILEFMYRHFEQRASGLKQQNTFRSGEIRVWEKEDYSLISHLRRNPGL